MNALTTSFCDHRVDPQETLELLMTLEDVVLELTRQTKILCNMIECNRSALAKNAVH